MILCPIVWHSDHGSYGLEISQKGLLASQHYFNNMKIQSVYLNIALHIYELLSRCGFLRLA